jgi:aminopeptidase N
MNDSTPRGRRAGLALCLLLALAPHARNASLPAGRNYHVRNYRLTLAFDWTERAVEGDAVVTVEPLRAPLREFELDAGQMQIHSVQTADRTPLPFQQRDPEKLSIQLLRQFEPGETTDVRIRYRARPRRGLKFLIPDENDPQRPRQIWTVGEPEKNHYWFPCNDSPSDFATAEIFATVDDPFRVISNGRLSEITRNADRHTATYHWRLDQPIPAYLVSIVVGEFDEIRHANPVVPMFSYVPPGRSAEGNLTLAGSPGILTFFATRLAVPYPFAKYSQTLVADFPGGIENTSATTLGDSLLHSERSHQEEGRNAELLLAHEMAHQWFGSLVGPSDWSDIWLNESFATYFAHLFQEEIHGEDALKLGMWNAQRVSIESWRAGNHRALTHSAYTDPDDLFDEVVYARGAAVLHMLRFVLGDELWWKSLRSYLNTYSHGTVDTDRFQKALEQTTRQNLGWFFDEWVRKSGQPSFEVTSSFDAHAREVRIRVHQAAPVFRTPVDICLATPSGTRKEHVWIARETEAYRFRVDASPEFIAFDCGGHLLKTLQFSRPVGELAAQALHDDDIAGRLGAVAELGRLADPAALEALADVVAGDPQPAVRAEAVQALTAAVEAPQHWSTVGHATRRGLTAALADPAAEVRRDAVKALARHPIPEFEDEILRMIEKDPSDSVVAEAVGTLVHTTVEESFGAVWKALDRPSRRDVVRVAALNALGVRAGRDPSVFSRVLPYARPPYPPAVRGAALSTALKAAPETQEAREESFSLCRAAMFGGGTLKLSAAKGFAELRDGRAVPLLEEFLRDDPNPGPFDQRFRQLAKEALVRIQAPSRPR